MACAISFATRNGEDVAPHRLTPGEFFPDPSWGVGSSYQLPLSRRPQPPKGVFPKREIGDCSLLQRERRPVDVVARSWCSRRCLGRLSQLPLVLEGTFSCRDGCSGRGWRYLASRMRWLSPSRHLATSVLLLAVDVASGIPGDELQPPTTILHCVFAPVMGPHLSVTWFTDGGY